MFHGFAGHIGVVALVPLTAFVVSLLFGARLIRLFTRKNVVEDTSQPDHAGLNEIQTRKKNVPTMGGLMIVAGILVATLLWVDLHSRYIWFGLGCVVLLAALGLTDDLVKLRGRGSRGLTKKEKLIVQFVVGGLLGTALFGLGGRRFDCRVFLPFVREPLDFGPWYILWTAFIVTAASNAVNLTDGLDGLAGGCAVIAALVLVLVGVMGIRNFLPNETYRLGASPGTILALGLLGATLGFLRYNFHPARIFMGDTGSLMIGGLLAYVALLLKVEVLFFLIGLVFFVDELTVALQIASFKLTRRRIFPITPIHHYFQVHRKWPEQKIAVRAWILGALAGIASLLVLRLS